MPLTPAELGYIAGIVDGEGSISLAHCSARASGVYVYPLVRVANTDKGLIDWLDEKVGVGHTGYVSKLHLGCKDVYHWAIASNEAYELLVKIRPYLVVKAHRADIVTALWEENETALRVAGRNNWGNHHPVPNWLRSWREACFLYLKDLNRRGPGEPKFGDKVRRLLQHHEVALAVWRESHAA
jgi:hypothetical protein